MSGVKLLTQTHYWIVPGLQRLKRRSLIHAWLIFGAYMLSHPEMRMTQQGLTIPSTKRTETLSHRGTVNIVIGHENVFLDTNTRRVISDPW